MQYQTSKSILFSKESTFVFVDYEYKRAICKLIQCIYIRIDDGKNKNKLHWSKIHLYVITAKRLSNIIH